MRKLLLALLLSIALNTVKAQDIHRNYTLREAVTLTACNESGILTGADGLPTGPRGSAESQTIPLDVEFSVYSKIPGYHIIYLWLFTSAEDKAKYNYFTNGQRKYFLLPDGHLLNSSISQKRYKTWSIQFTGGTAIVPIKLRSQPFEFSKDFTLGPTAGAKIRLSHYSDIFLNGLFGFGITSATIDDFSTNGAVKKTSNISSITPSFGLVMEFNRFQFGGFLGWDYVSKRDTDQWIYQGKPWYSFGVGFTILSSSVESNKTGEKKEQGR